MWNDSKFLAKLNIMDYSLLVAVDNEKNELVVGIVGKCFDSPCAQSSLICWFGLALYQTIFGHTHGTSVLRAG